MELKILSKKENPLFKREEIGAQVLGESGPTPKRKDLIVEAAKALGTSEDLVFIDRVDSKSTTQPHIRIFQYKKKEDIQKRVLEKSQQRIFGVTKKVPGEAPAPA